MIWHKIKNAITIACLLLTAVLFWAAFPITVTIICFVFVVCAWIGAIVDYIREINNED